MKFFLEYLNNVKLGKFHKSDLTNIFEKISFHFAKMDILVYLVHVDQFFVEELPVAGEDWLGEMDKVLEGRRHAPLDQEVTNEVDFFRIVSE